jgi:hypothetical protein
LANFDSIEELENKYKLEEVQNLKEKGFPPFTSIVIRPLKGNREKQ